MYFGETFDCFGDQVNVVNIVNAVNTNECPLKCENDVQCARKKMLDININFIAWVP